ncbi:MAG: hypothetical protein WDW20_04365 [Neisseriaceae bacterium]
MLVAQINLHADTRYGNGAPGGFGIGNNGGNGGGTGNNGGNGGVGIGNSGADAGSTSTNAGHGSGNGVSVDSKGAEDAGNRSMTGK